MKNGRFCSGALRDMVGGTQLSLRPAGVQPFPKDAQIPCKNLLRTPVALYVEPHRRAPSIAVEPCNHIAFTSRPWPYDHIQIAFIASCWLESRKSSEYRKIP